MTTAISKDSQVFLEIDRLFTLHKQTHRSIAQTSAKQRIKKLKKLRTAVETTYNEEIKEALFQDLRKHKTEIELNEIAPVVGAIKHTVKNLSYWMQDSAVPSPISLLGFSHQIKYEPKGCVLIISPWNFPLNLSLIPLIAAVAAGNAVILKPSEISSHTSDILAKIIASVFDEEEVSVVKGAIPETTHLLSKPFNHIFFTGAPSVGKIVMSAAAKHLTSVSLELGGKSPTIIDESADIDKAASRIAWAKNMNSGQICIAPDYILIHQSVKEKFISAYKDKIQDMFGENPQASDSYARVVSDRHFDRLNRYMKDAIEKGARIELGGQLDASEKYIAPTILSEMAEDSLIWTEEIFGPLMPLRTYKSIDEVIDYVNMGEKPLALYIYSRRKRITQRIINETSSGAVVVNNSATHYTNPHLPFGGVNNSGIGKGNGYFGFTAFSNNKAIQKHWLPINILKLIYPPYTDSKDKLARFVRKWLS